MSTPAHDIGLEPSAASSPYITEAELALIRAEALGGPIPDISKAADVASWRAEHQAELAGGDAALYKAAAEAEYVARVELEAGI